MTEYITIFEIPSKWTDDFFGLSILCAIVGLSLTITSIILTVKNSENWRTALYSLFFFIWGLVWSLSAYSAYKNTQFGRKLIEAYHSGNYKIMEGIVQVLHQQPKEGHDSGDLVRINGREIEFSYFRSTPAYHQTISHGGILKEGAYAKVYLYKGKILRIDIPKIEPKENN